MPRHNKNFKQELTRQLFGCHNRPLKHLGKCLYRRAVNTTNAIFHDLISGISGKRHTRRRRHRRRY